MNPFDLYMLLPVLLSRYPFTCLHVTLSFSPCLRALLLSLSVISYTDIFSPLLCSITFSSSLYLLYNYSLSSSTACLWAESMSLNIGLPTSPLSPLVLRDIFLPFTCVPLHAVSPSLYLRPLHFIP